MMGLSDRDKKLKYAKHVYNSPSFGIWHEWYAWYPVRVVSFEEQEYPGGFYLKFYRWVWLKKVARRKVTDYLDGPGRESAGTKKYYEYTTLLDILTHGH